MEGDEKEDSLSAGFPRPPKAEELSVPSPPNDGGRLKGSGGGREANIKTQAYSAGITAHVCRKGSFQMTLVLENL